MGTETTSATYRRTQTHESQSFSTELLEPKELTANIWHIHPKKQCCPPKRQLSPHLRNLTIKTRVLFHILLMKFHLCVLDANRFGIPVIYPEKFCRKWVQMRKYQACVFYMPILLRICPSGSAHYLQTFPDKLLETKNISPNT